MSNWYDHLRALLAAVDGLPPAEQVEALQQAQRDIQRGLAELWAAGASPGHAYQWQNVGKERSER